MAKFGTKNSKSCSLAQNSYNTYDYLQYMYILVGLHSQYRREGVMKSKQEGWITDLSTLTVSQLDSRFLVKSQGRLTVIHQNLTVKRLCLVKTTSV